MKGSPAPRPSTGHIAWTVVSWALYLSAALFLLLRAEGFEVNFREATVQETAVIAASFAHPTQATFGREIVNGTNAEFHNVAPGRQLLSLVADGRIPVRVMLDAVPRRVSRLIGATLAPVPVAPAAIRADIRLMAVTEDGRYGAVLPNGATTVEMLRFSEGGAETTARMEIPADVQPEKLQWLSSELLAVLCEDRILLLTQPPRVQEYLVREHPVALWSIPGTALTLVLAEEGSLFTLRQDGSIPERTLASVSAVGSSPNGSLLAVQGRSVVRIDGTVLSPPLPSGVRARGVLQDADTLHVWDAHAQHWKLGDNETWGIVPGSVEGVLPGEQPRFYGDGAVMDADGASLLRIEGSIRGGFAWSEDVLLLQRGTTLLHCSIALRRCEPLAEDIAQFWKTRGGLTLLRGSELSFLPLEEL